MAGKTTIDSAAVRRLFSPSGPVGGYVLRLLTRVERGAVGRAGVDTGELIGSFTHELQIRGNVLIGVVRARAPHALVHHEGSAPHVILPRRARRLVFRGRSGQLVFAKKVNHPGTRANRYLVDALSDVRGG